jgi:MoaD family protein
MAVRVHLAGYLRQFAEGAAEVELRGRLATARAVLDELWKRYPGMRDRVVTEVGDVRPHVNVFVAGESIRFTGGLDTPLGEGGEVHILPAVSGG